MPDAQPYRSLTTDAEVTELAGVPPAESASEPWTLEDAEALYRFGDWSGGYFAINDRGRVVARPNADASREVDLYEIVQGLAERDINTPILLRFSDILTHNLTHLRDAFDAAIEENGYEGGYSAVYPIKVNQQHQVVEEVRRVGAGLGFGLEVGSKPELLAVLAMTSETPDQLIVCNGFKDDAYIEAVILATKLGRRIIPVIENLDELRLIVEHAQKYDARPAIGVRVKLSTSGAGRWKDSAGARSKFGLFISELVDAHAMLERHGMLDCLQLIHCHIGSQVQDIRKIKDAVNELAQVYVRLQQMGAGLRYLDIGGGLGVDYTGAQANAESSMNYTVREYASDVVYRIASVCNAAGVQHPHVLTESGRAMVAYASLLVVDVMGATGPRQFETKPVASKYVAAGEEVPQPITDLYDAFDGMREDRLLECYHDAMQARDAAMTLFNMGYLSLPLRALAERLFWATCQKIERLAESLGEDKPEELDALDSILSDVYFCNFSIFQSLPDSWAIDQLFPIAPIHRLNERPTRRAILADVTCDSDGAVDHFINHKHGPGTLELHELHKGEDYFLGFFLVGAYQETLGDLHNLFGDTHVVHIELDEDGEWSIAEFVEGDTAAEVLSYMQYSPQNLSTRLARDCEHAVKTGRLTVAETRTLKRFFDFSLASYTYLDTPGVRTTAKDE